FLVQPLERGGHVLGWRGDRAGHVQRSRRGSGAGHGAVDLELDLGVEVHPGERLPTSAHAGARYVRGLTSAWCGRKCIAFAAVGALARNGIERAPPHLAPPAPLSAPWRSCRSSSSLPNPRDRGRPAFAGWLRTPPCASRPLASRPAAGPAPGRTRR